MMSWGASLLLSASAPDRNWNGIRWGEGLSVNRLTCGVSGNLFNNNLVMYDRRDNLSDPTLYPQMMGLGVFGPRTGHGLALLPVVETIWRYWKKLHPDTKVIGSNQPRSR